MSVEDASTSCRSVLRKRILKYMNIIIELGFPKILLPCGVTIWEEKLDIL